MATSGTIYGTTSNSNISVEINWTLEQSISGNYSNLTATLRYWYNDNYPSGSTWGTGTWGVVINGVDYHASKYVTINHSGVDVVSNTVQIPHNADGTCGDVAVSGYGSISGTTLKSTSISGDVSLPTIPRATTPALSASSVDMGSAVTIDLTSAASDSFTHDLTYQLPDGTAGTIATGIGRTTQSWTVPDFASSIPNAAGGTVAITCVTKSGGTAIGTKMVYLTANVPANVVPTISSVSVAEATSGIAARFGAYIQSKSALAVSITAAGAKGSTISSYSTTLQGKAYGGASFTSDALTTSGSISLVTTVTDSRGRTAKLTTTVTVLAYTPPQVSTFGAYRVNPSGSEDASGDYAAVRYAYSVPALNGGNTAAMAVKYKRSIDSDYNNTLLTGTALSTDETDKPETEISSDYRWDLKITVTDYFGAASSATVQLPSGQVILDIKADGTGIGVGKTAEEAGLDCGWPARLRAGLTIDGQGNGKNLLINPDFRVNQRGASAYNSGYGVDCWYLWSSNGSATVTVNDDYVSVSGAVDKAYIQYKEESQMKLLLGKALTLSLEKTDGTIISGSVTLPSTLPSSFTEYTAYSSNGISLMVALGPSGTTTYFQIFRLKDNSGSTLNIKRAKAEIGKISTLANDPPTNDDEELRRCQQRLARCGGMYLGAAFSYDHDVLVSVPANGLKDVHSIINAPTNVNVYGYGLQSLSSVTVKSISDQDIILDFTFSSFSVTYFHAYTMNFDSGYHFYLSAELC